MDHGADENFNSPFSHLRMRKTKTMDRPDHVENLENIGADEIEDLSSSNQIVEDDETLKNTAVFQQIALTRVKHQAEVLFSTLFI